MSENISVLIVDDEENARITLSDLLSEYGYKILEAKDGEEALEVFNKEKPNIVLLDTVLPGIDGFEVCCQIKAIKDQETKVIITTGKVDAVDAGKAREAYADDYVVKTSSFEQLIESIKKLS